MARVFDSIPDELIEWIAAQPLFFVASAPLAADGHVNLSPRGLDTFRVRGPKSVAWVDLTGSGAETIAHLRENGRVTVMFCAFNGPPRILRLHGRGRVAVVGTPEFTAAADGMPVVLGARAIVQVAVERVTTSCGFGVPVFDTVRQRDTLTKWAAKAGPDGLEDWWREKNAHSIDGQPALDR